jgi:hypothetical protein
MPIYRQLGLWLGYDDVDYPDKNYKTNVPEMENGYS